MWLWKCIVCEKDLTQNTCYSGDDDQASWPNLEGGTINMNFGFGSRFDDCNGIIRPGRVQHQACICDDCYEAKMGLTRPVITTQKREWNILDPDYRDQKRRRNQKKQT